MKRIGFILIFFLILVPLASEQDAGSRVLVLGFDLPEADSVERRFVREDVMRFLGEQGVPVVPVMELEGFFLGENPVREESSASERALRAWADRIPCGIIIAGKGEKDSSGVWIFHCTIYLVRENSFRHETMHINGPSGPDTKALAAEIRRFISAHITVQTR